MTWNRGFAIVFAVLTGATTADAQTPLPLTLEDAIARGVEHAPRLAGARAREAAAASVIASRAAARAPSITATSGYLRTNHIEAFSIPQPDGTIRPLFPDLPNNYRARAELTVPIVTSGRTAAAVGSATAELRAAEAESEVTEADVRLDVVRAYWALVTGRERVRVLEAELERMDAWVRDVQARVEAGFLPPNDVLSARAQRAREDVQLIRARHAASLAEMDLARLIGVELDQPIAAVTKVDEPLVAAVEAAAQPLETLIARARLRRAERTGMLRRQEALRAAGEAALAATRPLVAGLAAVEPSRPNARFVPRAPEWKTSWDLGVTLTWPLFDGGRARADRSASLAQAEAVGHQLEEFDALVAVEVRQRLLELEANAAALAAATEAISAAAEARRVVGERFNAGVAAPAEVLDAQTALLQAELERTQITAALRLGEARFLRTIGGL